jgi:hypothetical protein
MTYYHSGMDREAYIQMLGEEGSAGLVTVPWLLDDELIRAYMNYPDVPLALDSGAFQRLTSPSAFIRDLCMIEQGLLHDAGIGLDRFDWIAGLDVIGDQDTTDRYYKRVTAACGEVLWVYQVEGGKPPEHITSFAESGDLIGVGGLVPLLRTRTEEAAQRIESIGRVLHRIGARAHFFGVGSPRILTRYADAAWFASADSSKWMNGLKERRLYLPDGGSILAGKAGLSLTGLECGRQNIRQIDQWAAGGIERTLFAAA